MSGFRSFLADLRPAVDQALDRLLPVAGSPPASLTRAMRYSMSAGGKRVRPTLLVLAGEACGAARADLLPGAAAVEMVHTFSLIHDDLPALDDDDLRRGRPTLHRVEGEALAILAGDALLDQAFDVLAGEPVGMPPARRLEAVQLVARAVGTNGMIGGQVLDLEQEGADVDPGDPVERMASRQLLERIHRLKTGALIEVSMRLGGVYAGACDERRKALSSIGAELGLLFQIGDDILDVTASSEQLGKTPGKDERAAKLTYPHVFGLSGSREKARQAADRCLALIDGLPARRPLFRDLVTFLVHRGS